MWFYIRGAFLLGFDLLLVFVSFFEFVWLLKVCLKIYWFEVYLFGVLSFMVV